MNETQNERMNRRRTEKRLNTPCAECGVRHREWKSKYCSECSVIRRQFKQEIYRYNWRQKQKMIDK